MEDILYAVIVLNFNTSKDSRTAIESICNNATSEYYHICLVDNASTKEGEIDQLKNIELEYENVSLLLLNENRGYAFGNNEGIRFLEGKYNCKYYVIMNPDVEIIQLGTIESLISDINKESIIGAQALVDCDDVSETADSQINIRRVMNYSDILINSSWILKRVFKKRHNVLIYKNEMPFRKKIEFEVPSGAFFIIDAEFFKKIGLFDEKTFLYVEEMILGYKVKEQGKVFVLDPQYTVKHYQGKSTGSHRRTLSVFSEKCMVTSTCIYLQDYLHVGNTKRMFYRIVEKLSNKSKSILVK